MVLRFVVTIAVYNFFSWKYCTILLVVRDRLKLSIDLDPAMSDSQGATVPLDNDDLESDEETSLPNRRIIKDPVHGYRVSSPPSIITQRDDRRRVRREQSNSTLLFANL